MYPVPPQEKTYTRTEEYIGRWSKMKTNRDEIIMATKKIACPAESMQYIRGGQNKFTRKHNPSLSTIALDV